jgi:hypothetical protein
MYFHKPAWLNAAPAPRRRSFLAWLFNREGNTPMSNPRINVDKFGRDRVPPMSEFGRGARTQAEIEKSISDRESLIKEQNRPGNHPVRRD